MNVVQRRPVVGLVLVALLAAGCGGGRPRQGAGGVSAESVVEQALAAARDGDRAALDACVLPGPTSEQPFLDLQAQGSLKGVSWRVARSRDLEWRGTEPRLRKILIKFSPAVTMNGRSFSDLLAVAMVDTAENRKGQNLLIPAPTNPPPTGRWMVIASMLGNVSDGTR